MFKIPFFNKSKNAKRKLPAKKKRYVNLAELNREIEKANKKIKKLYATNKVEMMDGASVDINIAARAKKTLFSRIMGLGRIKSKITFT